MIKLNPTIQRSCRHVTRWASVLPLLCGLAWAQSPLSIVSVSATMQGGTEMVRIETSQPLKELPAAFAIQSPARISFDFPGASNATGKTLVEMNQGNLRSANVLEATDRSRVVLNLGQATTYDTRLDGKSLWITLRPVVQAATVATAAPAGVFTGSVVAAPGIRPLADIDFRRGADNTGRVIVNLNDPQTGVDVRPQGKHLVVDFLKTSLPEGLRRRLDVADFGTPVRMVSASQVGDRVRLLVEPSGNWEHSAYQSDNQFVLEVRQVKVDPNKLTQGPSYSGEKLSLNFQNIEVRALLQVIADFTNFNIITSDTVTGNVTLRLKDVPWDQAMDIVLQAKGLGMRKVGNVIRVAPRAELEKEEIEHRENTAKLEALEPLRTQVFRLNFAKGSEVVANLKGRSESGGNDDGKDKEASRLLSARGSAVHDERTNQVFVTDVATRLVAITDFVKSVDAPKRQVMIQARIVEATEGFGRALGVRLGGQTLGAFAGVMLVTRWVVTTVWRSVGRTTP